jgi:hypothetical protein
MLHGWKRVRVVWVVLHGIDVAIGVNRIPGGLWGWPNIRLRAWRTQNWVMRTRPGRLVVVVG